MTGHVFVLRGDLTALGVDDVLIPTDRDLTITEGFRAGLGDCCAGGRVDPGRLGGDLSRQRVRPLPDPPPLAGGGRRRPWLVDVSSDRDTGPQWFVDGVREFLAAVAQTDVMPNHRRARRVVALPLVGTGEGGAAHRRDLVITELLPVLHEAADRHDLDIALVLNDDRDYAAVQHMRVQGGYVDGVLPEHRRLAQDLAELARAGQLVLFAGAGISVSAGLPSWRRLLEELGEQAELTEHERAELAGLTPQDAAALLATRLGGHEGLEESIRRRFERRPQGLPHALLAALPFGQTVTTNYDSLLEDAMACAGRAPTLLPWEDPDPRRPWMLKLHGDAERPGEVVLTRAHYLRYDAERGALGGVVQALLLTRHVLFVGFSLVDENFIRITQTVDDVLRRARGDDVEQRVLGTALSLFDDRLRSELWAPRLRHVGLLPAEAKPERRAEAARTLEVFLDLLGALAASSQPYFLDERYEELLDAEDRALAKRLRELADDLGPDDVAGARGDLLDLLCRLGLRRR